MTKDPVVRSAKGGFEWRLKIEKVGDRYSFTDGWLSVVKDADLQYGDMLVFWLINDSAFKVAFYTMNECEKVLPPRNKEVKPEDEVEDEDGDSNDGPDVDHDDPYFVVIIPKTYDFLRLPKKFVGLPGIESEGTITMKNQDGKEWKLGVRRDKSYWTERFITSESKLCLAKVTKKKPDTEAVKRTQVRRPRQHGGRVDVESEDECVEVVKRGRGRPLSMLMTDLGLSQLISLVYLHSHSPPPPPPGDPVDTDVQNSVLMVTLISDPTLYRCLEVLPAGYFGCVFRVFCGNVVVARGLRWHSEYLKLLLFELHNPPITATLVLLELHTPLSTATLVYCDNVSVVYLFTNPMQHQRTQHIEIDIHFVREYVASSQVRVLHVPSRFQYADIFTKGLPTALFLEFRSSLNVRRSPAHTEGSISLV
ncbi:DNA-binding pseudobarrel domain-containing protein [Tanacetum coccineum]